MCAFEETPAPVLLNGDGRMSLGEAIGYGDGGAKERF
jgi:hypothetical protein